MQKSQIKAIKSNDGNRTRCLLCILVILAWDKLIVELVFQKHETISEYKVDFWLIVFMLEFFIFQHEPAEISENFQSIFPNRFTSNSNKDNGLRYAVVGWYWPQSRQFCVCWNYSHAITTSRLLASFRTKQKCTGNVDTIWIHSTNMKIQSKKCFMRTFWSTTNGFFRLFAKLHIPSCENKYISTLTSVNMLIAVSVIMIEKFLSVACVQV